MLKTNTAAISRGKIPIIPYVTALTELKNVFGKSAKSCL